jgi:hypothetical protein
MAVICQLQDAGAASVPSPLEMLDAEASVGHVTMKESLKYFSWERTRNLNVMA